VEVSTAPEGAKTLILDRDPSSRSPAAAAAAPAAPPLPRFRDAPFHGGRNRSENIWALRNWPQQRLI